MGPIVVQTHAGIKLRSDMHILCKAWGLLFLSFVLLVPLWRQWHNSISCKLAHLCRRREESDISIRQFAPRNAIGMADERARLMLVERASLGCF